MILENLGVAERGLDHRLGARLAIALQELALQRAGIDADPHRAAMVLGRLDDFAHPVGAADIAGIDPEAGGAGLGGFDAALIVEVDVGDDRHLDLFHDLLQRRGRILVRAGDPHDVGASRFGGLYLGHRSATSLVSVLVMVCTVIGASPPTRTEPDADLPGFPPQDVAIGTNAHEP